MAGASPLTGDPAIALDRGTLLARARERGRFRVLIIGAGINGLGLFRELALQGVDCLIVDRGDFCSGTSAAPSRMIHGGIKYLENGEFRLVREATVERNHLLRNAPHLVAPLETVIPLTSYIGGVGAALRRFVGLGGSSGNRGLAIVAVGLALYDFLGRRHRQMPTHRLLGGKALKALMPGIDPGFVAGAVYYDAAITQPERMGLELALDGMANFDGAIALNHVSLEHQNEGRVLLRDLLDDETIEIEPELLVNAAGPWIDQVNMCLGTDSRYIGGSKGSHLILDKPALLESLNGRMVYFESSDGRVCLVYPYLGRILLGSTDIPIDDPDAARCEDDEVAYMLAALQKIFPDIDVEPDDILYRYSGVRPLPRSDGTDIGKVSRDHSIPVCEANDRHPFPILSLVGGKWTTFRAFAEEAGDRVLERLGTERQADSADRPIGGGAGFPEDPEAFARNLAESYAITEERAAALLKRYGSKAAAVADFCKAGNDGPLEHQPSYTRREVHFLAERELVGRLEDILYARTTLAITGELDRPLIEEIASIAGVALGWDQKRQENEAARFTASLADRHGVELEPTP